MIWKGCDMRLDYSKSRRNFLKQGVFTGATILGLSKAEILKALTSDKSKKVIKKEPRRLRVEKTKILLSDGRYNSFTDIDYWKEKYYIIFRTGAGHNSKDSRIRLLESAKLTSWSVFIPPDTPMDDRDPKFLSTPDRLFIYTVCYDGVDVANMKPFVSYTDDGKVWSKPKQVQQNGIYKNGYSFWKPKTHKGYHYVAADITKPVKKIELLRSRVGSADEGLNWEWVSDICPASANKCTETSLVFLKNGSLLAITRETKSGAALAISRFTISSSPPYTAWKPYVNGPHYFAGPAAELIGDTVVIAARCQNAYYPDDQHPADGRTGLFTFDVERMTLDWHVNLLTRYGSDQSYAGILPAGNNRALVSYYDGQIGSHSDILLATVTL